MKKWVDLFINILLIPIKLLGWIISFIFNPNKIKGKRGESKVSNIIIRYKEPDEKIINNLIIEDNTKEKTTQIDHIWISHNGIYVIETKNYSGRIYGTETQRNWTQVLNYGKTKNHFYSPIFQNKTHIYILKQMINLPIPFYNLVVFVQNNTHYIKSNLVYTIKELKKLVKNKQKEHILSSQEIDKIYKQLNIYKSSVTINEREHIQNIKIEQKKIANNICPRCNAPLKKIKGEYGYFYGCSNYPHCKFTKKT